MKQVASLLYKIKNPYWTLNLVQFFFFNANIYEVIKLIDSWGIDFEISQFYIVQFLCIFVGLDVKG